MIWGILSTWLLRRYASFKGLWEASQISVEYCGKNPYREIWSAQCIIKCILEKLKCESSTKALFTREARCSLSEAKVRAFSVAVRPISFALRFLFSAVSSLEMLSALAFEALLARYLKNTSFVS